MKMTMQFTAMQEIIGRRNPVPIGKIVRRGANAPRLTIGPTCPASLSVMKRLTGDAEKITPATHRYIDVIYARNMVVVTFCPRLKAYEHIVLTLRTFSPVATNAANTKR